MLTKKEPPKNDLKSSKTTKNSGQTSPETTQPTKAPNQQPAKQVPTRDHPTPYSTHQTNQETADNNQSFSNHSPSSTKTTPKTRLTIKYDVGYSNQVFIRGRGANLNWDKGQPLKNVKPDEWVWETETHFNQCEFKVLINDRTYETGDNHLLNAGSTLFYTPRF